MYLLFGIIAIISTLLNVVWTIRQRDAKWFRFISLSSTALGLCSYYSLSKQWVLTGAADQLLDVMPTLSIVLWILTILSIVVNSISLFRKK